MTKKERMLAAFQHQPVDRIPRGEMGIEAGFLANFMAGANVDRPMSALQQEVYVREQLGFDFVVMHEFPRKLLYYAEDGYPVYQSPYGDVFKETPHNFLMVKPALEDIEDAESYEIPDPAAGTAFLLDFYKRNTDFFLICQINGPVGGADWALGMEEYMCYCMTDLELMEMFTAKIVDFEISRAKMFLERGAEAILVADDIAYNKGMLLPPAVMDVLAYPFYKKIIAEIKAVKDVPVLLHTDGYMHGVIPKLIECGFDGLQSLQPSAGMDIRKVKEEFGDKLTLMGNVDLNNLLPFGTPEEVKREVCDLAETVGPEGYILSTCNILTDAVTVENAKAMYYFDR